MKNIHVLPTEKKTRLFTSDSELILAGYPATTFKTGKNIYITSDEEIKEGDWVIFKGEDGRDRLMHIKEYCWTTDERKIYKMVGGGLTSQDMSKKIILTTDQDLIKDGVQVIPDEFLEFFVKNPSCEEVKINYEIYKKGVGLITSDWRMSKDDEYKIILPKEESKQETLEGKFQSWNELVKEVGSEEELLEILKLPHISTLVREAMKNNCKNK